MVSFAVFGNPIKHSKSAEIYKLFAKEVGISDSYNLKLVLQEEIFDQILRNFFTLGGIGANITTPFKERAFYICDRLTARAETARAVNTIKKYNEKFLLGDNTDGIGFIDDLKRLNWMNNNNELVDMMKNQQSVTNILLIGAGGAARGIIPFLLDIKNSQINIVNRSLLKAQILVDSYRKMGFKNIICSALNDLYNNTKQYHLIINATTSSMYKKIPSIPKSVITVRTKCYDLFYQNKDTSFLAWCKKNGSNYCTDGLGMLVLQAAHAFHLWHGIFPATDFVITYLRKYI